MFYKIWFSVLYLLDQQMQKFIELLILEYTSGFKVIYWT